MHHHWKGGRFAYRMVAYLSMYVGSVDPKQGELLVRLSVGPRGMSIKAGFNLDLQTDIDQGIN